MWDYLAAKSAPPKKEPPLPAAPLFKGGVTFILFGAGLKKVAHKSASNMAAKKKTVPKRASAKTSIITATESKQHKAPPKPPPNRDSPLAKMNKDDNPFGGPFSPTP